MTPASRAASVVGPTPGPWRPNEVGNGFGCGILDRNGVRIGGFEISRSDGSYDINRACDDAMLASAAPDLLAALEGLLTHYVTLVESGDAGSWDAEKEPQVIAARAAIARATGEQS
jgi:hypothetical protein